MIGNFRYNVDSKGRITVPAKLRIELGPVVFVTKDLDGALSIRTQKQFDEMQNELLKRGSLSRDARILQRAILGNSFEIELDKQGRILLPKTLVEQTNIKTEVVISAAGNRIEIFSAET